MKKAGILTFHYAVNYGAALQCYALKKKAEALGDISAEVINFIPPGWKPASGTTNEKTGKFNMFLRDKIKIEGPSFSELTSDIYGKYEYLIAGSDQIWNPSEAWSKLDYYTLEPAPDNIIKIAYAASIGTPVEMMTHGQIQKFKQFIPGFDFLSVREDTHNKFIQQFTEKKTETVLDPTLLLNASDYEEILINPGKNEKYILLYFLNHDLSAPNIISFCNKLSRKTGYKVIHNLQDLPANTFCNESGSFNSASPEEFVGLVKNAEIVITNSYHGTIFSIIFGRPFYSFIVKSMASRIYDLLCPLRLDDRIIEGFKPLSEVSFELDYNHAYGKLSIMKSNSERFLKNAFNIQ